MIASISPPLDGVYIEHGVGGTTTIIAYDVGDPILSILVGSHDYDDGLLSDAERFLGRHRSKLRLVTG